MKMTASLSESPSALTHLQRDVHAYMRAHSGEIITRERLCQEVWGMRYFNSSRTIDQTMSIVRKHLSREEQIVTVFRVGYRHLFLPNARD
jgi:DNA-binding response OmpR family regulator